jgi:ATP-dependent DNA helicase RecG
MKMTEKELELVLEDGEGYRIEFKETLAGLDKEMVAFANASGGHALIKKKLEKKRFFEYSYYLT